MNKHGYRFLVAIMTLAQWSTLCAATITFVKATPDGEWSDPANWTIDGSPAERIPEAGDDVVLNAPSSTQYDVTRAGGCGKVVALRVSTPELNSLTISGSRVLGLFGWNTCLRAKTISVSGTSGYPSMICAGGKYDTSALTHTFNETQESNRIWIVADSITVGSYSHIWATARGYAGGSGPGWQGVSSKAGCGAYGGLDGTWIVDGYTRDNRRIKTARTYGSIVEPLDPGTGSSATAYLAGGGSIRIDCKTISVASSATIQANSYLNTDYQMVGSGGSIWISCETLSGSGKITANAADMSGPSGVNNGGGAGGGGRIAITYDPAKQKDVVFTSIIEARGSVAYQLGGSGENKTAHAKRPRELGHSGTVYFTDNLIMSRPGFGVKGRVYTGSPAVPYDFSTSGDLVLNEAFFEFEDADRTLTIGGNLAITGSCATVNGFRFCGRNAKISVGGDASIKGGTIQMYDGGAVAIGGNLDLATGADYRNCAELYVVAAPTNDADQVGATVAIAGKLAIGAYSAVIPECNETNASIVAISAGSLEIAELGSVYAVEGGWGNQLGYGVPGWYYQGAAHGGHGGQKMSDGGVHDRGTVYGDEKLPLLPGSSSAAGAGGIPQRGGGVIFITTGGRMRIDGEINANGWGMRDSNYKGGSSGGSVLLKCGGKVSGAGTVTADGGLTPEKKDYNGCGGGGRVAIYASAFETNDLAIHALGGGQVYGQPEDDINWHGGNGSVYLKARKGLMVFVK